jgi:hypothetical protein
MATALYHNIQNESVIFTTVLILLAELKIEVRSDMRAANMTAIIIPLRPVGIRFITSSGYAMFVQPA